MAIGTPYAFWFRLDDFSPQMSRDGRIHLMGTLRISDWIELIAWLTYLLLTLTGKDEDYLLGEIDLEN
jgi:hypothetical protein